MSNNLPSKKDQFTLHGYIFSPQEFGVIQASESLPLKEMSQEDTYDILMLSAVTAVRNAGQKPLPDNEITFIVNGLSKWILNQKESIRVDEIIIALDLGSKGEYGEDVVFVSVRTCISWVRTYMSNKNKVMLQLMEAEERESVQAENEAAEKKTEEYERKFPGYVQGAFVYYKLTGKLPISAYIVCKGLDKLKYKNNGKGFLSEFVTIDDKLKIKDIATTQLRKEKKLIRYSKFEMVIKEAAFNYRYDGVIIRRCKELALMQYFDSLDIFDMTELKAIVTELINKRNNVD